MADTKSPNTLAMPGTQAAPEASERKVSVQLLYDVWINDPGHEDSDPTGIRRVRTNIPVLDDEGNPKIDRKTKSPVTTYSIVELPISIAKKMIDAGKANRMDPL